VECSNFLKILLGLLGRHTVNIEERKLLYKFTFIFLFYRYKEPIELLGQNVELLNTQRTEKLNRVKLVEKEKDELEGPKNEAMAYIKLENEVAQYKYSLKQVSIIFIQEIRTLL